MTVTYDLSTLTGKVRLLIGDKDVTNPVFTDEELTQFLTDAGSVVNLAAAAALEAWAASYSSNADSERIGDYAYTQKIVQNKLDTAKRLRDNDSTIPAMDWAEMALADDDIGEVED